MSHYNEQDIIAMQANLEAVAGPPARYADHSPGEEITYRVSSHETRRGIILYVTPPQQILSSHIPLTYLVDANCGWPDYVAQVDIIEEPPFPCD